MDFKEDKEDYFDRPFSKEEKKQPEPQKPEYSSTDPEYWEEPEPNWEHLKPRRDKRIPVFILACVAVVCILIVIYIRYFTPYIDYAVQYGYVDDIESKSGLFTTYHGVLIPYKEIHDTTRVYKEDFKFSVRDDHAASILKRLEYKRMPARITYRVYRLALPWNGNSKVVVTSADAVDPNKILPPEYSPERYKSHK